MAAFADAQHHAFDVHPQACRLFGDRSFDGVDQEVQRHRAVQ
jgi:hypothetical protein